MGEITFRYSSFTVPNPLRTANYMQRYTGGNEIPQRAAMHEFFGPSVVSAGLRYHYADGAAYVDVYFWIDHASDDLTYVRNFANALQASFAVNPDDWNWWEDWHICFNTADIDAIALRLMKDRVPFSNAAHGIYVMLPGGVTVQFIGHPSLYWGEHFYFCRQTTEQIFHASHYYMLNVTDIDSLPNRPLPTLIPVHHAFATVDPDANFEWARKVLAMREMVVNPIRDFANSNGSCAYVRWLTIPDYWFQMHFVQQKRKREGPLTIKHHEEHVIRQYRGTRQLASSALFGTRIGFSVKSFSSYVSEVNLSGQLHTLHEDHAVLMAPSGQLFDIFQEKDGLFRRSELTRLYPPSFEWPHVVAEPGLERTIRRAQDGDGSVRLVSPTWFAAAPCLFLILARRLPSRKIGSACL